MPLKIFIFVHIDPPTHPDNKGFRDFKKGRSSPAFLKVQFWFLNHILNWKDCQVDTIGLAPLFTSGDKSLRVAQHKKYLIFFHGSVYARSLIHSNLENVAFCFLSKTAKKKIYFILSQEKFALRTLIFCGRALIKLRLKSCLSQKLTVLPVFYVVFLS